MGGGFYNGDVLEKGGDGWIKRLFWRWGGLESIPAMELNKKGFFEVGMGWQMKAR